MSTITNIIIQVGTLDGAGQEALPVLDFAGQSLRRIAGDECEGGECWGGSRTPEVNLFAAAFNHIPRETIFNTLLTVPYAEPSCVRLFVQEQDEDCFGVYWLDMDREGRICWYPEWRRDDPVNEDRSVIGFETIEQLRNSLFRDPRLREVFGDNWRQAAARMSDQEMGETLRARLRNLINAIDQRDIGRFMRALVVQDVDMFVEALQGIVRSYRQS